MSERDDSHTHHDPHSQEPNVGARAQAEHGQPGQDHSHGEGHGGAVRQAEDNPNVRTIFLVGVVGIVITIVSVYISWGYQLSQEHMINAAPTPPTIPGTYEVQANAGILERGELPDRHYEVAHGEAQELKRDQEAQLSTYGWVDRPRGLIRIPVQQAMDKVVRTYGQHK